MNRVLLEVLNISYCNSQSGAYALLMGERGSKQYLPIIIGGTEAQSIAIILEDVKHHRPLTHDLFKDIADNYSIRVTEVVINKFKNGLFYSELHCECEGKVSIFDARPSDAIALALRYKCPIYTYPDIIEEAGISDDDIDNEDIDINNKNNNEDSNISIEDLKEMLQDAINNEDYMSAAKYRDLINERKKDQS